jgi:hypothetical protein
LFLGVVFSKQADRHGRLLADAFTPKKSIICAWPTMCDAAFPLFVFSRSDFENTFHEFSLNLHPSQDLMNKAYKVCYNLWWEQSERSKLAPRHILYFV